VGLAVPKTPEARNRSRVKENRSMASVSSSHGLRNHSPKLKDIRGNVYGRLTVIRFAGVKKNLAYWDCRCECGARKVIDGHSLRRGKTASCGCQARERIAALNFKDLTGQRVGRWTVLRRSKRKSRRVYWKCRCECGFEKDILADSLLHKRSLSCGCSGRAHRPNCIDLVGQRFGRLTVLKVAQRYRENGTGTLWRCQCDCGNFINVWAKYLRSGKTQSCGCYQRERTSIARLVDLTGRRFGRLTVLGRAENSGKRTYWRCRCDCGKVKDYWAGRLNNNRDGGCGCQQGTHRMSQSSEWRTWQGIKERCLNPLGSGYARYGAKGIKVCDRWLGENGFDNFYADMGEKPTPSHTLDRFPDRQGDYEPKNCRWATKREQGANRESVVEITLQDITLCVAEWSRRTGIGSGTLLRRYHAGWSPLDMLTTPCVRRAHPEYMQQLADLRERIGLPIE